MRRNRLTVSSTALVLYEHVATFSQEVQLIWLAKTSLATVLFLVNRYVLLSSATLNMLEKFNVSRNARKVLLVSQGICVIVFLATWTAFVMLRVYVMTARKWCPVNLVSVSFKLKCMMTTLYYLHQAALAESCFVAGLAPDIGPNIGFVLKAPLVTSHIFAILARASSILSDALVLVITFFGIQNAFTRAHTRMSRPLTSLVRDGMLYFMCVAPLVYKAKWHILAARYFCLIASTWLYISLEDHISPHSSFCRKSTLCSWTSSAHSLRLSSIIMSRFLLNIRQIQGPLDQASDEDCDDHSCPSSPSASLNTSIAMDSVVASSSLRSSIATVYV